MKKDYPRVCLEDSAYSLFLYFLISSKEEIESTYYFFSDGIPQTVCRFFQSQSHFFNPRYCKNRKIYHPVRFFYSLFLRWTAAWRWPFLKTANLYGLEICFFSPMLVGYRKMVSIEDGFSNYFVVDRKPKLPYLKRLFFGPLINCEFPGRDAKHLSKVVLTGMCDTGYPTDIEIEWLDMQKAWDISSNEKKQLILNIYAITADDIKELQQRDEIVLTQTLSEDNVITEEEKITFYKQMLKGKELSKVLIKPHPREKTDYARYFPGAFVFKKKVPMQFLNLLGIRYKKVYTICSTAAFSFPYKTDVMFLGSECHPNIVEKYGIVKRPDND